jgi:hypothetical protein
VSKSLVGRALPAASRKAWRAVPALLLTVAGSATACTPSPVNNYSPEEILARSEIFIGHVVKSEELPAQRPHSLSYLAVTYRLEEVIKGEPADTGVVVTSNSDCGAILPVGSDAIFFVDLQKTRDSIPLVDGFPPYVTRAFYGKFEQDKKFLSELKATLQEQSSANQQQ